MRVLSLFDGMSCGQIALNRIGRPPTSYFASEIDPYAVKITQKNYPKTVQLGDVRGVQYLRGADLLLGGSPCQGFSFAGKRLNFDDPRSRLFFEYVRVLELTKPRYFLLENVMMKQEYQDIITEALGVEPIVINSALVSAQNRKRLYWTNIPVEQPEDKGILLRDVVFHYGNALSEKALAYMDREVRDGRTHWDFNHHSDVRNSKSSAVVANWYKGVPYNVLKDWDYIRYFYPTEAEALQTVPYEYTSGVSKTQRFRMLGNGWTVDVIAHILKGME